MKTKNLFLAFAITGIALGFTSCKKSDNNSNDDVTAIVELSGDQAMSDNLTEDAGDLMMEVTVSEGLEGARPNTPFFSRGLIGCATVTVTPATGFPKTIVVDYGAGCPNGIRTGKVTIVLSDSVRTPGSTAVTTFDNYYVNGYKKEGTITWTNTSTATVKSWQRRVENGKITAPGGRFWLHSGVKDVVQTAGYSTPRNLLDDEFSVTGNSTVTNANNVTRTSAIVTPLIKKTVCENITAGSIQSQGLNHTSLIDFGNGDCDRVATISIDGGTPVTFLLRP